MMNRQIIKTIIGIVLLGAIAFFLMGYFSSQKEEVKPPVIEKELPFVKTKKVEYTNAFVDVEQTGRLISKGRVDLITEVNGKMMAGDVPLIAGQSFKKGDVLLRIYDKDAELSLKAAKSRFLSSIANVLPDLKFDYPENYQSWLNFFNEVKINEPLPDLPEVKNENERIYLAGKNIINDYFNIQTSEIILSRYTIGAPFDGAYSSVSMEVGSIANVGSRIARMIRTDVLELQVPISVEEVPYVRQGNKVEISYQGKTRMGEVDRVSEFVDPQSQSVLVYVEMKNTKDFPLYEGMFMKARFDQTELDQVMEIPREAVFNFDEVYTVADGKLNKTRVQVEKLDEYVAYISGLEEGSLVVTESLINASNQMPVRTK
jgi:multidrug efflux pump subunit AcrA (membrane-fusion protein)